MGLNCNIATTDALDTTYTFNLTNQTFQLTYNTTGAQTIDGQSLGIDMIVLVKNQVDLEENGIYVCTTAPDMGVAGILTLSSQFISPYQINNWGVINVLGGFANADTAWIVSSNVIQVGVSDVQIDSFPGQTAGVLPLQYYGSITTSVIDMNGSSTPNTAITSNPFVFPYFTGQVQEVIFDQLVADGAGAATQNWSGSGGTPVGSSDTAPFFTVDNSGFQALHSTLSYGLPNDLLPGVYKVEYMLSFGNATPIITVSLLFEPAMLGFTNIPLRQNIDTYINFGFNTYVSFVDYFTLSETASGDGGAFVWEAVGKNASSSAYNIIIGGPLRVTKLA